MKILNLSQEVINSAVIGRLSHVLVKSLLKALNKSEYKDELVSILQNQDVDVLVKPLLAQFNAGIKKTLTDETISQLKDDDLASDDYIDISNLYTQVVEFLNIVIEDFFPTLSKMFTNISDGSVSGKNVDASYIDYSKKMLNWIGEVENYAQGFQTKYSRLLTNQDRYNFLTDLADEFKSILDNAVQAGDQVYTRLIDSKSSLKDNPEVISAYSIYKAILNEIEKLQSDVTEVSLG